MLNDNTNDNDIQKKQSRTKPAIHTQQTPNRTPRNIADSRRTPERTLRGLTCDASSRLDAASSSLRGRGEIVGLLRASDVMWLYLALLLAQEAHTTGSIRKTKKHSSCHECCCLESIGFFLVDLFFLLSVACSKLLGLEAILLITVVHCFILFLLFRIVSCGRRENPDTSC